MTIAAPLPGRAPRGAATSRPLVDLLDRRGRLRAHASGGGTGPAFQAARPLGTGLGPRRHPDFTGWSVAACL